MLGNHHRKKLTPSSCTPIKAEDGAWDSTLEANNVVPSHNKPRYML
jgi:hypothetical protein